MEERHSSAERAEGKIRTAMVRLAGGYPFHAGVLERMRIEARREVGTMAVTASGDDVLLLHAPDFVLGVTADQLAGVLLHEVHHVLLGHILADPADYPDEWARTVAEEVTVNEFVGLPLPGEPITLARVRGLPPLESTAERYVRLEGRRCRPPVCSPRGSSCNGGGGCDGAARAGKTPRRRRARGGLGQTMDDHGVWAEAREDPARSR